ncbi:hypothetical protein HDV05_003108 [Chytridiales sp. JEL 0842]|nr:hypothetical protein HDV05_003108 [Chytridiales sp. JEL 0842]
MSADCIPDPPGFSLGHESVKSTKQLVSEDEQKAQEKNLTNLKMKKAWDVAIAPGKALPMNGFMLYMSGNSVQIFSVMVTVMLLFNAAKAIVAIQQAFEKFAIETKEKASNGVQGFLKDPLLLPKISFVVLQILTMGLGVYKLGAMGLLPTSHSDWLAFLPAKKKLEIM